MENSEKIIELEARPESTLLETIKQAEKSQEKKNGEDSIELWTKASALARICHGNRHYCYAMCHIRMAQCYLYILGLHEQSLHHSSEGLNIIEDLLPSDKLSSKVIHIHAICLSVLGEVQVHQGHLDKAEAHLVQAEKLSGVYGRSPEGEVDVLLDARVALNLGRLCFKQKKFRLAKECIEKGLELYQSLETRDAATELTVLFELADVHAQLHDHQSAIGCLNDADKLSSENFGSSSEERADTHMRMAAVHMSLLQRGSDENVTRAEDCLWNAYGIFSIVCGSSSLKAMTTQGEIIKLLIITDRHKEALKVLKDLIPNKIKTHGEGSLEVAKARKVLGSIHLYLGEINKASRELKQVREVFIAVFGPNHKESLEISKSLETLTGSVDGTKVDIQSSPFKTI